MAFFIEKSWDLFVRFPLHLQRQVIHDQLLLNSPRTGR